MVGVEASFLSGSTEEVSFALIFTCPVGGYRIDLHSTHYVGHNNGGAEERDLKQHLPIWTQHLFVKENFSGQLTLRFIC